MYPFIPWPNYIFDFQTFPIEGGAGGGNIKFLPANQKQSNSKLKLKLLMHRFIFLISFVCFFLRMKLIISLIKHSSLLLKLLSYSTTFSAPDFPVDCSVDFQEPAGTVYLQWVSAAGGISDYSQLFLLFHAHESEVVPRTQTLLSRCSPKKNLS